MEIIPLIRLEEAGTLDETLAAIEELLKQIDENKTIYILDIDGIEKNEPNLDIYQRISNSHDIWVDNGPCNIGDAVDAFMAGATKVTIIRELCPQIKISEIREITENEIYADLALDQEDIFYQEIDGIVNFNDKEKIEFDQRYNSLLTQYSTKNKLYCYESNIENISFWKKYNITGLLVDVDKHKEFENAIRI